MKRLIPVLLLVGMIAFGCKSEPEAANNETNTEATTSEVTTDPVEEVVEETPEVTNSGKKGVLIHISTGTDAFKFLLGLDMAERMAAGGNDVLVYFDHQAVNSMLKGAKNVSYNPLTPMNEQLDKLKAMGVKLRVCKPCLGAIWKTPEDLIADVTLADPAEFLTFSEGAILTLSY